MSYPVIALSPLPWDLLARLYRAGMSRFASDDELRTWVAGAGYPTVGGYFVQIHSYHSARRYEAATGHPF